MFINSIVRRFLFAFFGIALIFIIAINLYQMIYVNDNTYFGFRSVINAFNDFPYLLGDDPNATYVSGDINISFYYPQIFQNMYDHSIGLIQKIIDAFNGSGGVNDIINAILFIIELIFVPFRFVLDLICLIVSNVQAIAAILWWFVSLLFGTYNSNLPLVRV